MTTPASPRYRLPFGQLDDALMRLDTLVFGAWSPRIAGMVAASRTFAYHGGYAMVAGVPTVIADGTIVCTDNATRYIQRTAAGVVSADAALDPVTKIPMALVVCASGALTHFEDLRDLAFRPAIVGANGDLLIVDGSGHVVALAVGAEGKVLTVTSGIPAWATPAAGGLSGDIFWDCVAFLFHFDGTNASTTFTDEKGHTATAVGDAQLDTSVKKYGTASAKFDGTGDKITLASTTDLDFGNGPFTIEGWVITTQTGRQYATLMEKSNGSFNAGSWALNFNTATSGDGKVSFWQTDVSNSVPVVTSSGAINDGSWHHVAVVRVGNQILLWIDGALAGAVTSTVAFAANASTTIFGNSVFSTRDFNGHLDDWRITKGVARYTVPFTPPAAQLLGAP